MQAIQHPSGFFWDFSSFLFQTPILRHTVSLEFMKKWVALFFWKRKHDITVRNHCFWNTKRYFLVKGSFNRYIMQCTCLRCTANLYKLHNCSCTNYTHLYKYYPCIRVRPVRYYLLIMSWSGWKEAHTLFSSHWYVCIAMLCMWWSCHKYGEASCPKLCEYEYICCSGNPG